MKTYRTIVIVLAIILGICTTILVLHAPLPQEVLNNPITEKDYEVLKENALIVAKTMNENDLNDETLTASINFYVDELVVTVESIRAKLTAKIPISNHCLNVENGMIQFQGRIEIENVEYIELDQLLPAWLYITIAIFSGVSVAGCVYVFLFTIWNLLKQCCTISF